MLRRLMVWGVRSYVGGPAKSWVFTSVALMGLRLIRKVTGRRELVELSSIKPGETIIIEHLDISHKQQMKQMKKAKRQSRRARRQASRNSA